MIKYFNLIKNQLKLTLVELFNDIRQNPKKYLTLLGGILIMFTFGALGTQSSMNTYYMSYLRTEVGLTNVRYSKTLWIHSTQSISTSLAACLAGVVKNKYELSSRSLVFVGGFLMSLGFVLSYFTIQSSFFLFDLTFGAIQGIGFGCLWIQPISAAMKWFPNSKGFVTSIIMFGLGTGNFFFSYVGSSFINPQNISPDLPHPQDKLEKYFSNKYSDLLDRVPKAFFIVGCITFVFNFIGGIILFDKPNQIQNKEIEKNDQNQNEISTIQISTFNINDNKKNNDVNQEEEKIAKTVEIKNEDSIEILTMKEALKMPKLYMIAVMNSFYFVAPVVFTTIYKSFGQTFINDDRFLSLITSVSSIINIFVKFLWGIIIDRLSFKVAYIIINTSTIIVILSMIFQPYIGSKTIYFIAIYAVYCFEGGIAILLSTGYSKFFGQKNVTLVYGMVQVLGIPCSFMDSVLSPVSDYLGYAALFSISCIFPVIGWIVCVFFFKIKGQNGKNL